MIHAKGRVLVPGGLVLAAALGTFNLAWGQPAGPGPGGARATPTASTTTPATPPGIAAPTEPAALVSGPQVKQIAARSLARVALVDLRLAQSPGTDEFQCAAALLEQAHQLAPEDLDILRLLIEAAEQSGDSEMVERHNRALVRLDPADTVAQLRLVAGRIAQLQDVPSRLTAYDRFLGREGERLDPSVRSRLALDAALLRRETGAADAFVAGLRQALALDSTNAEAALLLLAFVSAGEHTLQARLEARLLVLMADPLDPQSHLEVAREAAAAGAAAQALRFFRNFEALTVAAGASIPSSIAAEIITARWITEGPTKVATELGDGVARARRQMEAAATRVKESPDKTAKIPDPMDARLNAEAERLWVVAASLADNQDLLDRAVADANLSLTRFEADASNPTLGLPGTTDLEVDRAVMERRADAAWVLLLAGANIDGAEARLNQIEESAEALPAGLARLRGWVKIRRGDLEGGRALLEPAADTDALSELGLVLASEIAGNKAEAARRYAKLSEELAGSMAGAWAWSKAGALGDPQVPPGSKRTAGAMLDGVPKFIDEMLRDPRRFLQMEATATAQNFRPLDKVGVKLTLRNVAPIPLPLGSERAINSRLLLSPSIEVGANAIRVPASEVVNLERRLRLKPGEELTAVLWPEAGYGGWATELLAGELVRVRWRILQGFRITDQGVTEAGPLSLSGGTEMIVKPPLARSSLPLSALFAALAAPSVAEIPELVGVVRWRLSRDSRGLEPLTPGDRDGLVSSLVALFNRLDDTGKVMVLAMMPPSAFIKSLKPLDEAAVAALGDSVPLITSYLVTRVAEPSDTILDAFASSPSATVKQVSAAMKKRLTVNPRTYSRMASTGTSGATAPPEANTLPPTTGTSTPAPTTPRAPAIPLAPPRPGGGR